MGKKQSKKDSTERGREIIERIKAGFVKNPANAVDLADIAERLLGHVDAALENPDLGNLRDGLVALNSEMPGFISGVQSLAQNATRLEEIARQYGERGEPHLEEEALGLKGKALELLSDQAYTLYMLMLIGAELFDDQGKPKALRDIKRAVLDLLELAPEDAEQLKDGYVQARLVIATHSFTGPMRRILLKKDREELRERVNVKEGGVKREHEVIARLGIPQGAMTLDKPESTLQRLQRTLLKNRDTSLLKVHLDLTNQAFRTKSDKPVIYYDLIDAAGRLGAAVQTHGSYHTDTIRSIYERVWALNFHFIDVYKVKDKRRGELFFNSPFWRVGDMGRAEEGDVINGMAILLENPAAPIIKVMMLEPGSWWQAAGMSQGYYFHLPSELLALPTDSRSETNHIAVRIAAELAVWERINQKGQPCELKRRVGQLLDKSGVATLEELQDDIQRRGNRAKRIRDYLAGGDGMGGAFKILRDSASFDIDISDEGAFFASGRGWLEKFWEAEIRLNLRPYSKIIEG